MQLYAIGIIKYQSGDIKIRLISPDKLKCIDVHTREIPFYANMDGGIRNIEVGKYDSIKWIQGSAERYPIIDLTTGVHRNEDAVIVLGVADTGIQKYYRVCNIAGQVVTVKAEELIEYGKVHKISNCKIVKKEKSEFISSIEGEIEEIDTKPKFKINSETGHLTLNVPFTLSDEIIIPEILEGRPLIDIESIEMIPASSALLIKKLTLSKYIKKISTSLFYSFRNLEELTILGKNVSIFDGAFTSMSKLRRIYIDSVRFNGCGICTGLSLLEEFVCGEPLEDIKSSSFSGCTSLNINSVLVNGTKNVRTKAFYGNRATSELEIPKSLVSVVDNSFEKCTGLKTVNIETDLLSIYTNARVNNKGLFMGIQPLEVKIGKNFVFGGGKIADTATIKVKEPTVQDLSLDRKIQKSGILGLSLASNKLLIETNEIVDAIIAIKQDDLDEAIAGLLDKLIKSPRTFQTDDISLGGFKLRVRLRGHTGMYKIEKKKNIGRFMVLMGKNIVFYPLDRELIINSLRKYDEIRPVVASKKYLKSVDIGDDGDIRLIYERDNKTTVNHLADFVSNN